MPKLPKLDTTLSEGGRWVEFVPGLRVLIARARNRAAVDMMTKEGLKSRRSGPTSPESLARLQKKITAYCIIRDWEGMEDDDGSPIPYSPEKAFEIVSNPEYVEFYEWVQIESGEEDEYRRHEVAESAGNSESSFAGN